MYKKRLFTCLTFILFVAACGNKNETTENEVSENVETNMVRFTNEQIEYAQIETGKIEKRIIQEKIHANGIISLPIDGIVSISPAIGGFLKELNVLPGEHVKKGALLAKLEHRDYLKLQQNYLQVKSNVDFMAKEYERQKNLVDQKAATEKTFEKIEAEYNSNRAELNSLKQQLIQIGINPEKISPENISGTIQLLAPEGGYISESEYNIGRYIGAQEVVFNLLCNKQMQIEINVFEKDILKIKKGQNVSFRLASDNSHAYRAKVVLIGRMVDQATKTVPIYCKFDEHYKFFRHGMKVTADIIINQNELYALPEQAVISSGDVDYVFQQVDNNVFKRIQVVTGPSSENYVSLTDFDSTLNNARIVVQGANYLEASL